uniref:C-type lectin domain-containing protein n=1 Tax=Cyprinus carpio TaxID=7962 RepID=A0A8C2A1T7_CYPCA
QCSTDVLWIIKLAVVLVKDNLLSYAPIYKSLSASVNSYVFYLVSEKMNWTDALTYCRQHHTDLATINDQTDLTELLKSLPSGFKDDFWIGLYRTGRYAPWVWSDGSISDWIFTSNSPLLF